VLRSGGLLREGAVLRSGHLLRAEHLLPQALPSPPSSLPKLRAANLLRPGGPVLWSGRLPDLPENGPGRSAGPADAQEGIVFRT
jgi:hypothetical protein